MYKNWSAIREVQDPWMKMLLITCCDEQVLLRLQTAFPNLFCKSEKQLFIPLSGLIQLVQGTEGGMWGDVLSELSMPSFDWGESLYAVAEHVPKEWHTIVMAAIASADHDYYVFDTQGGGHYEIEWNGESCVLVDAAAYGKSVPESITLVPRRFIDFTS